MIEIWSNALGYVSARISDEDIVLLINKVRVINKLRALVH